MKCVCTTFKQQNIAFLFIWLSYIENLINAAVRAYDCSRLCIFSDGQKQTSSVRILFVYQMLNSHCWKRFWNLWLTQQTVSHLPIQSIDPSNRHWMDQVSLRSIEFDGDLIAINVSIDYIALNLQYTTCIHLPSFISLHYLKREKIMKKKKKKK